MVTCPGGVERMRMSRRGLLGWLAAAPAWNATRPLWADTGFQGLDKAMWVWGDRILRPDALPAFVCAHNVGTLFLYVTPEAAHALLSGTHAAREAVAALRGSARQIHAMAGEPDWSWGPSRIPDHLDLLIRLQSVRPPLFDGIHLDVEPNAVEDWKKPEGKAALMRGALQFYDLVRAHAPDVAVDAAVNPVFADLTVSPGESFLSALARRVRSLSIMAYRDAIRPTLSWAVPAISQAAESNTPWRMGVQVDPDDPEPHTSWSGEPRLRFEAAMIDLDRQIRRRCSRSRYLGLVFQSFDGLRSALDGA